MQFNRTTGLHAARLKPKAGNPREVAFAEQWARERSDLISTLLQVPCGKDDPARINKLDPLFNFGDVPFTQPIGPATERDEIIAATVVQWLGSNCGIAMIGAALNQCGYQISRLGDGKRCW